MHVRALIGLVFLGLASRGFGHLPSSDTPVVSSHSAESQDRTGPEGVNFPNFKPVEFPFVTTMPDDGTDKGGGWQVAKVNLEFTRISLPFTVIKWYCPFNIGMPLRTEKRGIISPSSAANMSAAVANSVGAAIDFKVPQGIFCERFIVGMRTTFGPMYPGLGATVYK